MKTIHPSYTPHTPLVHPSYTPQQESHTLLIHSPYTPHTLFIRKSYTPRTLPIAYPYCIHTEAIHSSYTRSTLAIHYRHSEGYRDIFSVADQFPSEGRLSLWSVMPILGRIRAFIESEGDFVQLAPKKPGKYTQITFPIPGIFIKKKLITKSF